MVGEGGVDQGMLSIFKVFSEKGTFEQRLE